MPVKLATNPQQFKKKPQQIRTFFYKPQQKRNKPAQFDIFEIMC